VITNAAYSEKADVFSYGVVIWEVITRQAPWQGMQPMQIAYNVVHQVHDSSVFPCLGPISLILWPIQSMRPPVPPGISPPVQYLMQQYASYLTI